MNPLLKKSLLECDVVIIGSGIVGLSSAASILEKKPRCRVIVLERGFLPTGASTKNAGILGFEGFIDIFEDSHTLGEIKVRSQVEIQQEGVKRLLTRLGKDLTDYQQNGTYELLTEKELHHLEKIDYANKVLFPIFGENVFEVVNHKIKEMGFNENIVKALVFNKYGAQIDSGKTIKNLSEYVRKLGALIVTGAEVLDYKKTQNGIIVNVKSLNKDGNVNSFGCKKLVIATNAFSNKLLKNKVDLCPARGQVLVTKPIPGLKIRGTFHFEDDFYYGRNIGDRILIGGARNTDFESEETEKFENTEKIISNVKRILQEIILPNHTFEIEHQWAGIMGFGKNSRDRILKEVEEDVYAGFRFCGTGMSTASYVGDILSEMVLQRKITPKL